MRIIEGTDDPAHDTDNDCLLLLDGGRASLSKCCNFVLFFNSRSNAFFFFGFLIVCVDHCFMYFLKFGGLFFKKDLSLKIRKCNDIPHAGILNIVISRD